MKIGFYGCIHIQIKLALGALYHNTFKIFIEVVLEFHIDHVSLDV